MNYEQNYEKNLAVLKLQNPTLHDKLSQLEDSGNFEVFDMGDEGFDILDKERELLVYGGTPNTFTEEKYKNFDEEWGVLPFTYHFGIGNGAYFKILAQRPHMVRMVVIEPHIEIIYIAFHLHDFSQELMSGVLHLYLADDLTYAESSKIFRNYKGAVLYARVYTLDMFTPYYESEKLSSIEINDLLLQGILQTAHSAGNNSLDTFLGIKQHVANLNNVIKNPSLRSLEKGCKNSDIAIIVATGPSLVKQLPLLKEIQDFVTIISVDASFPILCKEDIQPDIVVSIERGAETMILYNRCPAKYHKKAVFALTSVVHPKLIDTVQGGQVSFSFRNYAYINYFGLNDYCFLGYGSSVANMAHEIAILSGFKQCVLIGQDLAYAEDGKSHAAGHVYGETSIKQDNNAVLVKRYGGEGEIKSHFIWRLFKNNFEEVIEANKDKNVPTINATEGGARIEGTIEMPFAEVVEKYAQRDKQKKPIKLKKPTKKEIQKLTDNIESTLRKILTLLLEIKESVKDLYDDIATTTKAIMSSNAFISCDPKLYEEILVLNKRIDKTKRGVLSGELEDILHVILRNTTTQLEMQTAVLYTKPLRSPRDKEVFMLKWPFMHRDWAFEVMTAIEFMIQAIGLGMLINGDEKILSEFLTQEEIAYLKENPTLFDFPNVEEPIE